jgi:NAD(P)-dependent dehydrogenase (short-subunit alcohol dehydrogenase family)
MAGDSCIERDFTERRDSLKQEGVVFIVGNAFGIGELLTHRLQEAGLSVITFTHELTSERADDWECALLSVIGSIKRVDYAVILTDKYISRPFLETDETDWDEIFFENLDKAFRVSRALLPALKAQKEGSIVFLSAPSSRTGLAGCALYASAKGALLGFVRSLALEAAPDNIRVNLVSTSRNQGLKDPDSVADVFCYLLGEGSSFITGQDVMVG